MIEQKILSKFFHFQEKLKKIIFVAKTREKHRENVEKTKKEEKFVREKTHFSSGILTIQLGVLRRD